LNQAITYSEAELAASLRRQDDKAFSYLYDHYSGALFGIIHSILADQQASEDVLQQVFLNIWRKIGLYDAAKGRLFTWMLNIARNAAIDELRSRGYKDQKRNVSIPDEGETGMVVAAVPQQTRDVGLRKIITRLKEEWRQLIELSYFDGYTHEEISRMLGLPLGTVKTRIRNALIELKTLLQ
jgi:RNA polymerase sigma factor (sigma-70 family)